MPIDCGSLSRPEIVASAVSRPLNPRFCSSSFSTCARSTLHAFTFSSPVGPAPRRTNAPSTVERLVAARQPEILDRDLDSARYCMAASVPARCATPCPVPRAPARAGESPGDRDGRSRSRSRRARASAPGGWSRTRGASPRRSSSRHLVELHAAKLDKRRVGSSPRHARWRSPGRRP